MKYVFLLLGFLAVSCNNNTSKNPTAENEALTQMRSRIDSLFAAEILQDEPGAAVFVAHQGKMIVGKGFGLRDLDSREPITTRTNMRMASVSKQFTALTLLSLIDSGKLSLSDTVYNIIPIESFKDVTIEQLINHTSGRADAEEVFYTEWDSTKIAENKDILAWYTEQDRTVTKPGEKWQYNNGIYEFIPCVVEKISGQEFSKFAKTEVFEKFGMENTNFFNLARPVVIAERASCYERDSLGVWNKVDGHYLNGLLGAGGVYTSVEDFFNYDTALWNESVFSKESHNLIFKPSATIAESRSNAQYAMGWIIEEDTANHGGSWFGTQTFVKRFLNDSLTYAVFMNRNTLFESGVVKKLDAIVSEYLEKQSEAMQENQ
jgi:CubicO group peptidase (beta-lactamase class C family)